MNSIMLPRDWAYRISTCVCALLLVYHLLRY